MGKALYRTYRSRGFDEVVGQAHVTDLLKNAIASGKISHAYLLTGPRGVGKTSVARIIAHAVNGLDYSEDTHLDIIEIDAASNRRIDDIRDLREKVHIAPVSAPYKVYIIDEVHMLTNESFNALLKTIEEPPEHAIFILATTEVHKVPATIVSRTQRYHFRPASTSDIATHLTYIAGKEKIAFEPDALELIAQHADGSFRDSVSLLDQLSGLSEKITTKLVESVLGMAPKERVTKLVAAVTSGDTPTILETIDALLTEGISPVVLTSQIAQVVTKLARQNHSLFSLLDELVDVPKAHDPQLKLVVALVKHARATTHKSAPALSTHITQPSITATPAALKAVEKTVKKDLVTPKKMPQKPVEPAVVEPTVPRSSNDSAFDWDATLRMVKKHHAPLYSVLSRATHTFVDNKLTLSFAYSLHRKKLENPTYKKQLSSTISNMFDFEPEIIIGDGLSETASEDVKIVTAIMGGGDIVSASI